MDRSVKGAAKSVKGAAKSMKPGGRVGMRMKSGVTAMNYDLWEGDSKKKSSPTIAGLLIRIVSG